MIVKVNKKVKIIMVVVRRRKVINILEVIQYKMKEQRVLFKIIIIKI